MTDGDLAAERGIALLNLGRAVEAEAHFRVALAADPGNADVLVHLAEALQRQERHSEARDAARQALGVSPGHLGGLIVLSAALAGLKDFEGSLEAVRHGLQVAPALAGLHRQEGAILIEQDRPLEALVPLERARSLDPESSDTAALFAAALFNARRFAEAELAVADALRLDPDNPDAHHIRGLLSLRRGGGRTAVEAHRTAVRLDPTQQHSREGLATAMKSRNPLYGLLLRYSYWLDGLPGGARLLILLVPFLASRILRPVNDQLWAQITLGLLVAAVVLSWALEPIMNSLLLCSSYSRNLLPRDAKLATYAFLAYVAGALVAFASSLVTSSGAVMLLVFGLTVWSLTAGQAHLVSESRRKIALRLHTAGALLAVASAAAAAFGAPAAMALGAALLISGIAMFWFTALA